ncbi:MAG: DUF736 family protein [Alphaproteobacteria bacterium]|nr:DUF736 family protein [Alphaproteobacteria bacterium]MBV8548776.1 DUF736 family protein [Alphaproteobacteria bacterium]
MKKIGCFKKEGSLFVGAITFLPAEVQTRIMPATSKFSSVSPDYVVTHQGATDFHAEIGMGWDEYLPQHDIRYISVTLDAPTLPRPIDAVLCEDFDEQWYLFWDRLYGGRHMVETLYVQEELKPQLGIKPIQNMTANLQIHFPQLVA